MDKLNIPEFETKEELFKFLKDNKATLERQKKAEVKHADSVIFVNGKSSAVEIMKAVGESANPNELKVKVVINTTNLLDSHGDVHQVGIWNKSIKDNNGILFLQEHRMAFDKIIADGNELKVSVETFTWKELGFNFTGTTQALVFDAVIKRERNPEMFKQYENGWVKEHSVGMRYMQLVLCVNSEKEWYGAEKEAWDKYLPTVVNKELAEERGWFYAVKEAKVVEGSAVPKGSNFATPTLEVGKGETIEELKARIKELELNQEPPEGTPKHTEPPEGTQTKSIIINHLN
jgi:hypothetical protein